MVGAQKAGTTALFHYLSRCPDIYLPAEKEAPFFSRDDRFNLGLDWYLDTYFADATDRQIIGSITPQYLCATYIPDRIRASFREIRLIAILRHPIDRARSHFKMLQERQMTTLPVDVLFRQLMSPAVAAQARDLEVRMDNEAQCCLVWSEYGRLLQAYYDLFSRRQLLVLVYEDYLDKPSALIDEVLDFIGAKPGFRPDNLGRRYFDSAEDPLRFIKTALLRTPLPQLWLKLPRKARYWTRIALSDRLPRLAARNGSVARIHISADVQAELVNYYRADVALLKRITGRDFPWLEFQ